MKEWIKVGEIVARVLAWIVVVGFGVIWGIEVLGIVWYWWFRGETPK